MLTAEALQTLIDNHSPEYEKDWELPVTVIDQLKGVYKILLPVGFHVYENILQIIYFVTRTEYVVAP